MPIRSKKQRFTTTNINNAPECNGVYAIWRYNELIYIGKAEGEKGIRSRLQIAQRDKRRRGKATSFQIEKNDKPLERETQLLEEYQRLHGKLPRYNKRIG
jgi:excinuclease UvrABC nuclease subunit